MTGDEATTRRGRIGNAFRELGGVERIAPIVFALLYIAVLLGRLMA